MRITFRLKTRTVFIDKYYAFPTVNTDRWNKVVLNIYLTIKIDYFTIELRVVHFIHNCGIVNKMNNKW
jgi:hypothetical protein